MQVVVFVIEATWYQPAVAIYTHPPTAIQLVLPTLTLTFELTDGCV